MQFIGITNSDFNYSILSETVTTID